MYLRVLICIILSRRCNLTYNVSFKVFFKFLNFEILKVAEISKLEISKFLNCFVDHVTYIISKL